MGENTRILWTNHTFNPWIGCARIAPGCDHCYAAAQAARYGWDVWGPHATYRVTSDEYWKQPVRWNRRAEKSGKRARVFCASMADVFDNHGLADVRARLWEMIRVTPMLDWQLLTKRPGNIERYLPTDWGKGYPNVWLGATCENRRHGLPRVDVLREIPARVRFLSCEPLLEDLGEIDLRRIHWLIAGGESGTNARRMDAQWVWSLRRQCAAQNVAFFFKQWGGKTADAGGCELDGMEVKEWPKVA